MEGVNMIQFILACLIAGTVTFWFFAAVGRLVAGPIARSEKPFFYQRVLRFTIWTWGLIIGIGTIIAMGFWGFAAIILFFTIKSLSSHPKYDEPNHRHWDIEVK